MGPINPAKSRGPLRLILAHCCGNEAGNRAFGITLILFAEARQAALELRCGTLGDDVMYFETGQDSALSAGANLGVRSANLRGAALGNNQTKPGN
jgi:ethanolamine ammonia-lyase large subunit